MTGHPADPDAAPAAPGRGRGHRVALVATWLLGGPLVVLGVTATGAAGRVGGWAWAAGAVLPLVALTWWSTRGLRSRRGLRAAGLVLGAAVVAALVAGAPPGYDRLGQVAVALPVPAEALLVRTDTEGSTSCFQGCPSVVHHYAVPDVDAAEEALAGELTSAGWVRDGGAWRRGSFQVVLSAEEALPMAEVLPPRVDPPAGWDLLAVTVGSGR